MIHLSPPGVGVIGCCALAKVTDRYTIFIRKFWPKPVITLSGHLKKKLLRIVLWEEKLVNLFKRLMGLSSGAYFPLSMPIQYRMSSILSRGQYTGPPTSFFSQNMQSYISVYK
jgi:hypothetical protein